MSTTTNRVPFIPETAPFTEEQRQWLNGFLAGLFSGVESTAFTPAAATPPAKIVEKKPVLILFGSQTGNAEGLAKKLKGEAEKRGFAPKLTDMAHFDPADLQKESNVLVVTSTWGEGDPPDNAVGFWEKLAGGGHPPLNNINYSVLALGDKNYQDFCGCGKKFDRRLEELGARRLAPRQDCDTDYDEPAKNWIGTVMEVLAKIEAPAAGHQDEGDHSAPSASELATSGEPTRGDIAVAPKAAVVAYSRTNPFLARLLVNRRLTSPDSAKDTRHYEICLAGSGLSYEVGDALGLMPANSPELVEEMLKALSFDGEEEVTGADGTKKPIRLALLRDYAIRAPHKEFLEAIAARDGADAFLKDMLDPNVRTELDRYLFGREIVDFLLESPKLGFKPDEFVKLLRKLQPRLYSIASSLKAHPEQVHLTVDTLRYEAHGRKRAGVSSVFLAERVAQETLLPVFIQQSKHFRPPEDPARPMIMVGPGTGIAPFRAFLQERTATGAPGKNWLYFGAQRRTSDFFYKEELETMRTGGTLTKLDVAFSRDQDDKIYVQHLMLRNGAEMYRWLQENAHFYVCGDAKRMAKDVDDALHQLIREHGCMSEDDAKAFVSNMKKEKRYQRDVY